MTYKVSSGTLSLYTLIRWRKSSLGRIFNSSYLAGSATTTTVYTLSSSAYHRFVSVHFVIATLEVLIDVD